MRLRPLALIGLTLAAGAASFSGCGINTESDAEFTDGDTGRGLTGGNPAGGRGGGSVEAGTAGKGGGGGKAGTAGSGAMPAKGGAAQVGDPCKVVADCNDNNVCTVDSCIGGACTYTPGLGQTDCDDDDDRCNGYGVCDGIVCKHKKETEPKIDDNDPCTNNICDKKTGSVVFVAKVQPTDSSKCLIVSCNPVTGVVEKQNLLDDGKKCTIDECDLALGAVHTDKPTGDGDPCTADSCDPATGEVKHVPIPNCEGCNPDKEGKSEFLCNDDNPCTTETCTKCTQPGCKGGTCGSAIVQDGTDIDDGKLCNGVTVCVGGKPSTRPPTSIDDKDVCTIDSCNPANGEPEHVAVPTDDGNKCTTDACDPTKGISHLAIVPNDNDPCITSQICDPGAPGNGFVVKYQDGCKRCLGGEPDCDEKDQIEPCVDYVCEGPEGRTKCVPHNRDADYPPCTTTAGICETKSCIAGRCERADKPNDASCDSDSIACNGTAKCQGGACVDVPPKPLVASVGCVTPTCTEPKGDVELVPKGGNCEACLAGNDCDRPPPEYAMGCAVGTCTNLECVYKSVGNGTKCGPTTACKTRGSCNPDGTCSAEEDIDNCCQATSDCEVKDACHPTPTCPSGSGNRTCAQGALLPCAPVCADDRTVRTPVCVGNGDCSQANGATINCSLMGGKVCAGGACVPCTTGPDTRCSSKICGNNMQCCGGGGGACGTQDCSPNANGCPPCSCGTKTCQVNMTGAAGGAGAPPAMTCQ